MSVHQLLRLAAIEVLVLLCEIMLFDSFFYLVHLLRQDQSNHNSSHPSSCQRRSEGGFVAGQDFLQLVQFRQTGAKASRLQLQLSCLVIRVLVEKGDQFREVAVGDRTRMQRAVAMVACIHQFSRPEQCLPSGAFGVLFLRYLQQLEEITCAFAFSNTEHQCSAKLHFRRPN